MKQIVETGSDIYIIPPVHRHTIIWLHGLGDSAYGFLPIFEELDILPDCKIVLLTAPKQPVTVNRGAVMNSWYDIESFDKNTLHPQAIESAQRISRVIEEERKYTENIILGGLSQGGAMALYTGLVVYPNPLKAVVALSTYAFDMEIPERSKQTPVFIYHGEADELIKEKMARRTYETVLGSMNYHYETETMLGHGLSDREIERMSEWLRSLVNTKANVQYLGCQAW